MLFERQERVVEVAVRQENECVSSGMWTEGEDACDGSVRSSKGAIVTHSEATFDAGAVKEREEGGDAMVRMRDRVDMHRRMTGGGGCSQDR